MDQEQRPPLIVLVVDEAADLAETEAMETLKELGRKAQGFGISVIVGTQKPTVDAVDTHLRANLETPIAFKTRTASDSRVILDRVGAEALDRPGLALTYVGQRWRKVQVLYAEPEMMEDILGDVKADRVVLSEVEQALVRYAVEELDGAFIINKLYEALGDRISKHALTKLGKRWQHRGWLSDPEHATAPRNVTGKLRSLAYTKVPQKPKRRDR
jgi:DNA segregation ATPase FtsK/SpoIIIE-like protein